MRADRAMAGAPIREPAPGAAPRPVRRAAITNLGCKVNQAEMDALERLLRGRGVELSVDGGAADLHVVNTCTVTAIADEKSRRAVRRARRASPDALIVVTGCSVQVGRDALAAADPAATLVDNEEKDELLGRVEALLGPAGAPARSLGRRPSASPHGPIDGPLPTLAGVEGEDIADGRARIERTRAFVKVQDGCSYHCTYCIIPRARGPERSLPPEVVMADARRALADGHRELVLTGINVGTFGGGRSEHAPRGGHRGAALTLAGLVRRLLAETAVERLRISSIEPQHVDDELLATMAGSGGRCLPHLHLPLQSGDDGVLRRMGRRYVTAFYARTVERVRTALPGAAVHADLIVGFPTEDAAAWARTLAFVRSLDFAGLHVFRYSARPGTPATRMAGQVPEPIRRARAAALLALAAPARRGFVARAIGAERLVLFEVPDGAGGWVGHAEDHLLVRARAPDARSLEGEIARVVIGAQDPVDPERAIGRIVALVPRPDAAERGPAGRALPVVPFAPGAPPGSVPAPIPAPLPGGRP